MYYLQIHFLKVNLQMIPRFALPTLERLAKGFRVVALTGPRQSGKTTLARSAFKEKPYVSLENPDELEFARSDPRRFLGRFKQGAVIDEIQRCPTLLSWLQGVVDERQVMGDFIITGSAQFDLIAAVSQSLAGRVGRLELLPLSMAEIRAHNDTPRTLGQTLLRGSYPALYAQPVEPPDWFPNYIATYVERDVRQLLAIHDLAKFQIFLKMCAARTGQLLNIAALGIDCGISTTTAKQWLSVLEASYIITMLRPHHRNFGKRLVKSPKLYFLDTGIAVWLMGIRDAQTLETHSARGALFETWVISELIKKRLNAGRPLDLYFWRDSTGNEVDVLFEIGERLMPIEIKSGCTFVSEWANGLKTWQKQTQAQGQPAHLIYGGAASFAREGLDIWGWRDVDQVIAA